MIFLSYILGQNGLIFVFFFHFCLFACMYVCMYLCIYVCVVYFLHVCMHPWQPEVDDTALLLHSPKQGLLIKFKDPRNVYTARQLALGLSQRALPSEAGVSSRTPGVPGICVGFWGSERGSPHLLSKCFSC